MRAGPEGRSGPRAARSGAPRQKWAPGAKLTCRIRPRSMSSSSGRSNTLGSRLAAFSTRWTRSPARNRRPAVLDVLAGQPEDHLHRSIHPQELLHRVCDPSGFRPEARRQGRVADEPQHAARDEVRGRLMPGEEDEHQGVDDLVVAEVRAVAQQELGEIVAGRPAMLLHQGVGSAPPWPAPRAPRRRTSYRARYSRRRRERSGRAGPTSA